MAMKVQNDMTDASILDLLLQATGEGPTRWAMFYLSKKAQLCFEQLAIKVQACQNLEAV